ncbi:MAG: ATP-binding cassette domain-containing protein [Thermodesulfobacteriota bacterium]
MIEAFRLGVRVRGATLWDGLDFAFEEGSVSVIVGPPSSGKTVLLSVLRGERRPDAGDVLAFGESLFRGSESFLRAFRASCGFVPERFDAEARQTVNGLFERSAMVVGNLPPGERKDRRERLLSMVELSVAGDAPLSDLSMSERARVTLAAELMRSPRVLFADGIVHSAGEPFAGRIGSLFRALARAGIIVLLAERRLPARWTAFAGPGKPAGPFLVHRMPAKGGVD